MIASPAEKVSSLLKTHFLKAIEIPMDTEIQAYCHKYIESVKQLMLSAFKIVSFASKIL
ncbi:hypothetical protein D3C80_1180030 [compost metagenome]